MELGEQLVTIVCRSLMKTKFPDFSQILALYFTMRPCNITQELPSKLSFHEQPSLFPFVFQTTNQFIQTQKRQKITPELLSNLTFHEQPSLFPFIFLTTNQFILTQKRQNITPELPSNLLFLEQPSLFPFILQTTN